MYLYNSFFSYLGPSALQNRFLSSPIGIQMFERLCFTMIYFNITFQGKVEKMGWTMFKTPHF